MGISNNVKLMVQAVADNDMVRAKAFAKAVIAADTSKGNAGWRSAMLNRLDMQVADLKGILPPDLEGLLQVEDSVSYRPERYALLDREASAFERVGRLVRVCARLGEMGIRYPNVTLLYGESGTGKTEFGRYIGHALGLPFAYLNFSQAIDSHLGATSKNIHRVFQFVRTTPCVLMLDEVDTIAGMRYAGQGAEKELARVTVTIMQELDALPNEAVVIAATNLPELIDLALMRRFRFEHEVRRPADANEACSVACRFLDGCGVPYNKRGVMSWMKAERLDGETQATIIGAVVEAIAQALDAAGEELCQNPAMAADAPTMQPLFKEPGGMPNRPLLELGA